MAKAKIREKVLASAKLERSSKVRTVVLSEDMTPAEGAVYLHRIAQEEEKEVVIKRTIPGFLTEVVAAMAATIVSEDWYQTMPPTSGMVNPFTGEPLPVRLETYRIGYAATMRFPVDNLVLPQHDTLLGWRYEYDPEDGPRVHLFAKTKGKHQEIVEALCSDIERNVKERSIYSGGVALRFRWGVIRDADGDPTGVEGPLEPEFMSPEPRDFDRDLVWSDRIKRRLRNAVVLPLAYAEKYRSTPGLLRSNVVLGGEPGTGKSEVMLAVQNLAIEHGHCFIEVMSPDHLEHALRFAIRRPGLSVVSLEDIDKAFGGEERTDELNTKLNTVDGIVGKNAEVLLIATTNHPERLNEAFKRGGRIGHYVRLPRPGPEQARELLERKLTHNPTLTGEGVRLSVDFGRVGPQFEDLTCADMDDVIKNAIKVSVPLGVLTSDILLDCLEDKTEQRDLQRVRPPKQIAPNSLEHVSDGLDKLARAIEGRSNGAVQSPQAS